MKNQYENICPPKWADRLLRAVIPGDLAEELSGDLHEQFFEELEQNALQKARRQYLLEVLKFVRPYFLKRRIASHTAKPAVSGSPSHLFNTKEYPSPFFLHPDMLRNYLKIAFRNLWKSKGYTAVNVIGLSVAFCICVFLFLLSYIHITYDSFHADGDRIFKTYFVANDPERTDRNGNMPMPLEPALKAEYPEIEGAARIMSGRKSAVELNGKYFDKMVVMTDPEFMKIFSFQLLKGNRSNVLGNLSNIVISENMASDIFGTEDPVGKSLLVGSGSGQKQYIVTGVMEDSPYNSSIQYDAVIRIESDNNYNNDKSNWGANSHALFVKLSANTDQATLEGKLKPFTQKYFAGTIDELKKKRCKTRSARRYFCAKIAKTSKCSFR